MNASRANQLNGRRHALRAGRGRRSPRWQFLRGFLKHPVMVGSVIPSSKILIDKMLKPVDWSNARLFVEYGPGVGTFTRPILDRLNKDARLIRNGERSSFAVSVDPIRRGSAMTPPSMRVTPLATSAAAISSSSGFPNEGSPEPRKVTSP